MRKHLSLWLVLALLAYLSFLILYEYWEYLLFAIIFAVLFMGSYRSLTKRIPKSLAGIIVVSLTFLLLVIPTMYVVVNTVAQAPAAYESAIAGIDKENVRAILGVTGDEVRTLTVAAGQTLRTNVLTNAANYASKITDIILGLAIMFLALFFLVRDGDLIYVFFIEHFPAKHAYTKGFIQQMRSVVLAIVLGQVVTALLQGVLISVILWALGIPNPMFWGVITAIVSVVPLVGPALIYLPASVYLFLQDRYVASIGLLLFGIAIVSQVENIIRPYVASKTARIHPLTVILGVLGGIKLWGIVGFVVGPLVLAACLTLYKFAAKQSRNERAEA